MRAFCAAGVARWLARTARPGLAWVVGGMLATSAGGHVQAQTTPQSIPPSLSNPAHPALAHQVMVVATPESPPSGAAPTSQGPAADRLTLNFQSIDIRALLHIMADFTGLNLVVSDTVTGAVTLRLKDVPWREALDIILGSRGLAMRQAGNVLHIAPQAEVAAREKTDLEARQGRQVIEPMLTQDFKLNYARAAEVSRSLMGTSGVGATRILSLRGSAIADVRTNQIFVTDIPNRLEQVQAMIRKLDIPVRQVLIEARIVEASEAFGRSLGARLGGRPFTLNDSRNTQFGGQYIPPVIPAGTQPIRGQNFGTTAGDFVNLPATGLNGFTAPAFAMSLFNSSLTRLLNLEISAMEADGKGKIVSSPRIVTTDQVKALIEQGTELPYQKSGTQIQGPSIEWRKASLKLEVTPQITPEGSIILNLDITKDSVGRLTLNGFAIDTKHVQTQVLVENGGTVVIGGIFEQSERVDESKVPFLGDLPGLGLLFKSRTRSTNKAEMMVFITPKLLADVSLPP